jgi:hypothetical protein
MTWLFGLIALAAVVALAAWGLANADPRRLASTLRVAVPMLLTIPGAAFIWLGRPQLGFMLLSVAAGMWFVSRSSGAGAPSTPRTSTVRTAALEMELDHAAGTLEGLVLVGAFEGRTLSTLSQTELLRLLGELASDAESVQLLETYLDSRFPTWREDAEPNVGDGMAGPPGSGAMTEKEAYQILGLEAGASAADIRKAHRRLMQRLHPDLGGTSFLASRINEAKDFLLSLHG